MITNRIEFIHKHMHICAYLSFINIFYFFNFILFLNFTYFIHFISICWIYTYTFYINLSFSRYLILFLFCTYLLIFTLKIFIFFSDMYKYLFFFQIYNTTFAVHYIFSIGWSFLILHYGFAIWLHKHNLFFWWTCKLSLMIKYKSCLKMSS